VSDEPDDQLGAVGTKLEEETERAIPLNEWWRLKQHLNTYTDGGMGEKKRAMLDAFDLTIEAGPPFWRRR
jgi:hypothetical protein